jgi:exonuclease SbcC
MRPHRLRFAGIGPYPDEVTIDFDELTTKGLYLIVGPTGSGKSTIFDAMTYALFGKTASGRESTIVCDSPIARKPYVELEFSHAGRHFTAHREPGVGDKAANPNKQWLREHDASGKELRTVPHSREVTREVSDLIGLDADQFMQIILLPQGKFQEFLMATGDKKGPLLQTIFGTKLYSTIAQFIEDEARQCITASEAAAQSLEGEVRGARAVISQLPELFDPGAPYESVEELDYARLSARERAIAAAEALEILDVELERAISELATADNTAKVFDAAAERNAIEKVDRETADQVADGARAIAQHDHAKRVDKQRKGRDDAKTRAENAAAAALDYRDGLGRILADLPISHTSLERLKDAVPSASAAGIHTEFAKLSDLVALAGAALSTLDKQAPALKKIEAKRDKASGRLTTAKAKLKATKAAHAKLTAEVKAANKANVELRKLQPQIDKLDRALAEGDVASATSDYDRAVSALAKSDAAVQEAKEALDNAHRQHIVHLAGTLAASLEVGTACPVCGSHEHPKKARKSAEIDLDSANAKVQDAQSYRSDALAELKDAEKTLAKAKKSAAILPTPADQKALRKAYEAAVALAESLDELEGELEEKADEIEGLETSIESLEAEVRDAKDSLKDVQKEIADAARMIEPLGEVEDVKVAVRTIERVGKFLSTAESILGAVDTTRGAFTEASKSFVGLLESEGFTDEAQLDQAMLDDQTYNDITTLLEASAARKTALIRIEGVIGDNAIPDVRPDVDAIQANRDKISDQRRDIDSERSTYSTTADQLELFIGNIRTLAPEVEAKRRLAYKAKSASDLIRKGAGHGEGRRFGLEEWVQRRFFDEVCEVATEQMRLLYNSRYTLTLEQGDGKAKKKSTGLDLYVFDSQTGKHRPVQTLSGGEQFLTSLALALALAEVVQRHAGGIELPALFIDEGFGSLDTNTLDTAIDVLMKLQDTGRSIGIISHVDAMQKSLPIGISVTKKPTGSILSVHN